MHATRSEEHRERIIRWFEQRDQELRSTIGSAVHDTTHGIFGATAVQDAFALCDRLGLHEGMRFCDLGSGDGRVALVAALFCPSTGIEADPALHAIAQRARAELVADIPTLERCELALGDYRDADLSGFDILFAFADHAWPLEVEEALDRRERPGVIVAHQDIFRPQVLRKGPTIWIGQAPFVTYPIGRRGRPDT